MSNPTSFEGLKLKILAKLQDRLDPSTSKRMPASLLRQSTRQHAEQLVDSEAPRLGKPERDRLVEEVLAELLGYGPLDVLFRDTAVNEVMVAGPQAILARRDQGWVPTNAKFRDEEHVRTTLEKLSSHADFVGGTLTSLAALDMKLPNGFRVVAIVPPPALGLPALATFVRVDTPGLTPPPVPTPQAVLPATPNPTTKSGSSSVRIPTPPPRQSPLDSTAPGEGQIARHRARITERIITKLASLGVFDLARIEVPELRKVIAAYVREYCNTEHIYLSDSDQARLMLEILAGMKR